MLNIYYVNIEEFDVDLLLNTLSEFISFERRKKIKRFKFDSDKKKSVLSELLVKYGLIVDSLIPKQNIIIYKTIYGKPHLKNSNRFFNISHSGNYVICAISDNEVGIDIEKYGREREDVIQYFHPKEIYELDNIGKEMQSQFLYQLWSFKESYIKYLGIGLFMRLSTFYIKSNGEKYEVRNNRGKIDCKIESLNIDRKYACSVCYKSGTINKVTPIHANNLLRLKNY